MGKTYLAVDLGGGSGRVMAGFIKDDKLVIKEVLRFPNRQIALGNHIYWDFLSLFEDVKLGLKKASHDYINIVSLAVDTWGVDFGLVDKNGNLMGNPLCYRDARTNGIPQEVFQLINESDYYSRTGIQVMAINTIFQLYSQKQENEEFLKQAHQLLFMPDLVSYFLTGEFGNEYCISSTSGMLDAEKKNWDIGTLEKIGIPKQILGKVIRPGTVRGKLASSIAKETGLGKIDVISVGSHDTASAVMALPTQNSNVAFLSSGTWSLLGTILEKPILTEDARKAGFTNEGGVGGKIRFLQNITGLWILQRLTAEWEQNGKKISYSELIDQASESVCSSKIDVDDTVFMNPVSMEKTIATFCRQREQHVPQSKGEFVYCVLSSLAKRYKHAVDEMNKLVSKPVSELHIIGGGSQNALLNQLTANELNLSVISGPIEATAIGNILTQAWTLGDIKSIAELHKTAIATAKTSVFYPQKNTCKNEFEL
ncbi:MAG: rhamnulokinase [Paludibacteraceae bacterium]